MAYIRLGNSPSDTVISMGDLRPTLVNGCQLRTLTGLETVVSQIGRNFTSGKALSSILPMLACRPHTYIHTHTYTSPWFEVEVNDSYK